MSHTYSPLREHVHDVAVRIAQDLGSRTASELDAEVRGSLPHQGLALAMGISGAALLFDELESRQPGQFTEARDRVLEYLGEQMTKAEMLPSLFNGAVGVLFALRTAQGRMARALDELCDDLEDALADWLVVDARSHPWTDLISGLSGAGIYFCGRPPSPRSRRCIERLVDLLDSRTRIDATSTSLPAYTDSRQDEYDHIAASEEVGVAHGLAGELLFLLLAQNALQDSRPHLRRMIGASASRLARTLHAPDHDYRHLITARPSWCRGELGIAHVLCVLGHASGDPTYTELARDLTVRSAAALSRPHTFADASFCHGWAGAAHLYRRLSDQLGAPEFALHSRVLIERSLEARGAQGYGGYLFALDRPDGTTEIAACCGLLSGSSGTALALLSALSPRPLRWERALGVFS